MIVRKGISGDAAPHGDFEHPDRHRGASKIAKKGPKNGLKNIKRKCLRDGLVMVSDTLCSALYIWEPKM